MSNFRMMPPISIGQQTRLANGRTYSAAPGVAIDVFDADAEVLTANSWVKVALSGATAARPSPTLGVSPPYLATPGFQFLDTTLGKFVVFDGQNWRDPLTGSVA